MSEAPYYKVEVICTNCQWAGRVEILKGNPVHTKPCPNCECGLLKVKDGP
jgi:hypothetical protein